MLSNYTGYPMTATVSGTISTTTDIPQTAGGISVVAQDYLQSVAEGDISGHSLFSQFGRVSGVTTNVIDVWPLASAYTFPATFTSLVVVSSAAGDGVAGAGALKVKVNFLTSTYADQTEEVTLNGTTGVTMSATTCLRVNRVWISSAGANGVASGNIDVINATTSATYARIETGFSRTRQLAYTVPLGKTLYITSVRASSGAYNTTNNASNIVPVAFTLRAGVDPASGAKSTIFYPVLETIVVNGAVVIPLEVPIKIPATADFRVVAQADVSSTGVRAQVAVRGWLE